MPTMHHVRERPALDMYHASGALPSEAPTEILRLDVIRDDRPSYSAPIREHLPPSKEIGLGRNAVRLAMQEAMYAASGTPYDEAQHESRRKENLEEARDVLAGMDTVQAAKLQQLLLTQPESAWIRQQVGMTGNDEGSSLIDKLSARDIQGNYVVPNEVFQSFLEWHNHVIAAKQHELDQQIDALKDEYKRDIRQAVHDGWMPAVVLERLDKLDNTLIYVDDGLSTDVRSARGYARAMAKGDYSIITLSPSIVENPRKTLRHEFDHILEGQDALEENPPEHEGRLRASHGLYRLFGSTKGGGAMNEAVTEHVRSSLDNGSVDTIDPTHKKRRGTYKKERRLLDVLVHTGVKKVDVRAFIAAYFEDDMNIKKRDSAAQDLYSQLREAFPFTDVAREIHWLDEGASIQEYALKLKERSDEYKKLNKARIFRRVTKKAA